MSPSHVFFCSSDTHSSTYCEVFAFASGVLSLLKLRCGLVSARSGIRVSVMK